MAAGPRLASNKASVTDNGYIYQVHLFALVKFRGWLLPAPK